MEPIPSSDRRIDAAAILLHMTLGIMLATRVETRRAAAILAAEPIGAARPRLARSTLERNLR